MSDPIQRTRKPRPRPSISRLRLRLAHATLAWERLWPALWPAAMVAGLFLALALFGLLPLLPGWAHAGLLALFALAFVAALGLGLRRLAFPGPEAALRRLERDSNLAHRPLSGLGDTLAGGADDPMAAALWRAHQERLRRQAKALRLKAPHPNLAGRDPLALRALVGLLLFVAAVGTWGDWRPRLSAALAPDLDGGSAATAAALDIWVTPPDYTGLAPVYLHALPPAPEGATVRPVTVPVNSTVMARVNGGSDLPELRVGEQATPFEAIEPGRYEISRDIAEGEVLAVHQDGEALGAWPIEVVPDHAPTIAFAAPPSHTERSALRLDYTATDDYGIETVMGTIRLADDGAAARGAAPLELELPAPRARKGEARSSSFHDLTPHPWAGLPVRLRLSATDAAGQTGTTEDVELVLPERVFTHPVARAIVELRRRLTLQPEAREDVAQNLAALQTRPDLYGGDVVVHLGLRTAIARLFLDRTEEAVPAVQQLLWELALRIEDGGVSIAERNLREAERALQEALENGASDEELERLMNELQQAMNEFLDAMEEQIRQALERGEMQLMEIPPLMQDQMVDRQDLQDMLEQMRQMAQTGARDAAQQMLSQLQQMLENLRAGAMAGMQPQQQQSGQMLNQLQDMVRRQQDLLDRSFQEGQNMAPQGQMQGQMPGQMPGGMPNRQSRPGERGQPGDQGQRGPGQTGQLSAEQEALRRELGELMRQLGEMGGEIPRSLGQAELSMRDAGQALNQGLPGEAVPPQSQALDQLQQGLQAMAEQMAQQMMGMPGMPGMPGSQQMQRTGRGRDPLGRPRPGMGQVDTGDVEVPDQSDIQRAREILDELRRRAGEYERPKLERDYIDRLLRQF